MRKKKDTNRLIIKQELFCQCLMAWGTDTWDNALKSYEKAGYVSKWPGQKAATLLKKYKIQKRMAILRAETLKRLGEKFGLDNDYIIERMIRNEKILHRQGDIKGSEACLVDLGRTRAMFTDNTNVNIAEPWKDKEKTAHQIAQDVALAILYKHLFALIAGTYEIQLIRITDGEKSSFPDILGEFEMPEAVEIEGVIPQRLDAPNPRKPKNAKELEARFEIPTEPVEQPAQQGVKRSKTLDLPQEPIEWPTDTGRSEERKPTHSLSSFE